jgi:hypothetical protein
MDSERRCDTWVVDLPEEKASELLSWRGVTVVPVTRALRDLLHDMTMRSLSLEQGVLGRLAEGQLEGEIVGVGAEAGESEGRGAEGPSEQQLSEAASDVTEWHPIVLYHAVKTKEAALLLQPWGALLSSLIIFPHPLSKLSRHQHKRGEFGVVLM